MTRLTGYALLVLAVHAAGVARAQSDTQTIWNCKDREGRILVTSLKEDTVGKECRVVQQTRVTVVPATQVKASPSPATAAPKPGAKATASASPAGFPRETPADRTKGREKQRQALEGELVQEEQLLAQARRELAQQESMRSGDERNYAKVLERLQKYRDNVEVHEKNIEALKRELANLQR